MSPDGGRAEREARTFSETTEPGWTVRGRRRLVDSRWLQVDREAVTLPDGSRLDDFYVVTEPDWAMAFAVTEAGQVLLVRQYKHGIGRVMLELPAGYLEPAEPSPEAAIRRELREETGYAAGVVQRLGRFVTSPTRSRQHGHLFLVTGCRLVGAQALDRSECIEVVLVAPAELRQLVQSGAIEAESSVAAIYRGLDALGQLSAEPR